MRVHDILKKAMRGEIHWFQAAEILGVSPHSLRRWREYHERGGEAALDGLHDRPSSPQRMAGTEIDRVVQLYRQRYAGMSVRAFHQLASREHGVRLSYSRVRQALRDTQPREAPAAGL